MCSRNAYFFFLRVSLGVCDGFGGQAGQQERQCWSVYKCFCTMQLTEGTSANKAISASEHQSKVGTCSSLDEESFGWLGTGGIAVLVTDSASFVPELHTPRSVCLQVSTPVPNICARCCWCVCQENKSCHRAFAMCWCLASLCFVQQSDLLCGKRIVYQRGKITIDLRVLLLKKFVWLL